MHEQFYESMAEHYHLIFEDWDESMRWQGAVIAKLLPPPGEAGPILDVACGIGTQSLALAMLGYAVTGSDISVAEVARANKEAMSRGLSCSFCVDDMRVLASAAVGTYAAVIAMDNALPHLDSDDDIVAAFTAVRNCLSPGGKVVVSVRDYASHLKGRPTCMPPVFYGGDGHRRVVFQVWDWIDDRRYTVHLHIDRETSQGWVAHHFVGRYRAVTTDEIMALADRAGLRDISSLPPGSTGFYQPIIVARAP